jgi:hypothetical protein
MKQVTDTLEAEGVAVFKASFEELLQRLDDKRRKLAQEQAAQGDQKAEAAARGAGYPVEIAGAASASFTPTDHNGLALESHARRSGEGHDELDC